MSDIDRNRRFTASCVAIATTGVVFSFRGDVLDARGTKFRLSRYQLGLLLSPAFLGNTVANVIGGAGNLAIAFVLPVIGAWYDMQGAAAAFRYVAVLPAILPVIFTALLFYYTSRGGYRPVTLANDRNLAEGA